MSTDPKVWIKNSRKNMDNNRLSEFTCRQFQESRQVDLQQNGKGNMIRRRKTPCIQ
jgi:hypothetical protein